MMGEPGPRALFAPGPTCVIIYGQSFNVRVSRNILNISRFWFTLHTALHKRVPVALGFF